MANAISNANQPLVTIITPSFNQGRFIEHTIKSVLDQDYPNIEYLVVDGGSSDQTLEILQQYGGRLSWISEPDRGQSDAVNKGIDRTSGQIIGWVNSDDMYCPGAVSAAVACFVSYPEAMLAYGQAEWISESGAVIGPSVSVEPFCLRRLLRYSNFVVQPAAFFRRQALEAIGGLDPSLNFVMDYDLWIRLGKRYGAVRLDRTLARARCYRQTKTVSGGRQRFEEMVRMLERHGGRGLPAYYRIELGALEWGESLQMFRRGRFGRAVATAARGAAAMTDPRVARALLTPHTWRIIRSRRRRESHQGGSESEGADPR